LVRARLRDTAPGRQRARRPAGAFLADLGSMIRHQAGGRSASFGYLFRAVMCTNPSRKIVLNLSSRSAPPVKTWRESSHALATPGDIVFYGTPGELSEGGRHEEGKGAL